MEKIKTTESELKEMFLKDMKLFKRFLKDNGAYPSVYEYVLPKNKMTIDEFYEKCKLLYIDRGMYLNYDFRDILHIVLTIDISYHELGHSYWEFNIKQISKKFIDYYSKQKGYSYERRKYEIIKEEETISANPYFVWDSTSA